MDDDETGTEPDVSTPETSSLTPQAPGGLFPDSIGPLVPKTPTAPQSLCLINPTHPDCQPATPLPTPITLPEDYSPFGTLRGGLTPGDQTLKGICILDPSDPRCQQTISPRPSLTPSLTPSPTPSPTQPATSPFGTLRGGLTPGDQTLVFPSTPSPAPGSQLLGPPSTTTPTPTLTTTPPTTLAPIAGPKSPGSQTPGILCIVNPNHPQCQPQTPDFTRALPSPTPTAPQFISLCILNPTHPDCLNLARGFQRNFSGFDTFVPAKSPDVNRALTPEPPTRPQSICIINPSDPSCQ